MDAVRMCCLPIHSFEDQLLAHSTVLGQPG
uniref:Uncharacterized protein n=1 Tax=Lepeophtheirus salmonis TaxID=72036 RepID=A0A0K2V2B2_LEPSM